MKTVSVTVKLGKKTCHSLLVLRYMIDIGFNTGHNDDVVIMQLAFIRTNRHAVLWDNLNCIVGLWMEEIKVSYDQI